MAASYAVSVRRASVLPAASFRSHLAVDTLAVRLAVPPVGPAKDFHLQVSAPGRAHEEDKTFAPQRLLSIKLILRFFGGRPFGANKPLAKANLSFYKAFS
jgi:hypothetical protein